MSTKPGPQKQELPSNTPPPSRLLRLLSTAVRFVNRLSVRRRAPSPTPQRIIVVRQGMIGDVIQTTASLEDLRQSFPDAHIAYMTGSAGSVVLEGNESLDEIVPYIATPERSLASLRKFIGQIRELRRKKFDLGLSLNHSSYDALLLRLMAVREAVGFVEPQREFLLDRALVWDEAEIKARQTRFDDLLRLLDIEPRCRHYIFHPTTAPGQYARELIQEAKSQDRPLLVIAPGGGTHPPGASPYRQWLPERFAQVLTILSDELQALPVLIGDSNDLPTSQKVLDALKPDMRVRVRDLTGKTSLPDVGALLENARLLITNDTAPVWIAAAVDCPTVAIFGCAHPEVAQPLSMHYVSVKSNIACHPCYRGDDVPDCDIPPPCLSTITRHDVIDAANQLLSHQYYARDAF
jgi:heptosyltransferase II